MTEEIKGLDLPDTAAGPAGSALGPVQPAPRKIRCVKCGRIIRVTTGELLDFGDGTGQHIVCPAPTQAWSQLWTRGPSTRRKSR
jgi:hypothetical protein